MVSISIEKIEENLAKAKEELEFWERAKSLLLDPRIASLNADAASHPYAAPPSASAVSDHYSTPLNPHAAPEPYIAPVEPISTSAPEPLTSTPLSGPRPYGEFKKTIFETITSDLRPRHSA